MSDLERSLREMAESTGERAPVEDDLRWLGPSTAALSPWKIGDRVAVNLPIRPSGRWEWVEGNVTAINNHERPGVTVTFDEPVNGLPNCYATHGELRPA